MIENRIKLIIGVLGVFILLFSNSVFSNSQALSSTHQDSIKQSELIPIDSTNYVRRDGILIPVNNYIPIDYRKTLYDTIFYNPVFLPVVFNGRILPSNLNFINGNYGLNSEQKSKFHLLSPDSTFIPFTKSIEWNQSVRKHYFTENPSHIKYSAFSLENIKSIDNPTMLSPTVFKDKIMGKKSEYNTKIQLNKYIPKSIYWTKSGEHSLQVNQTQYSENWYSSGYSNYSVANYHKLVLNYKKDKISWNNTLEWKLNFQKTPADSLHNLSITSDYFRAYTVVGISLSNKRWSYTLTNEIKSPFFRSYKINTATPTASFLSPLTTTTGIGLTYSLSKKYKSDKNRKLSLSLDLSPVSLSYTYVRDTLVDETHYDVDKGKKSNTDFGSTYNVNFSYTHNRNSTFTSRLKYFTSYSKVVFESENKYTFSFTRLLSSTLYLYLRYDDGVAASKKDDKIGYFQYNELVGFGLTYTW